MNYKSFLVRQVVIISISVVAVILLTVGATYSIFIQRNANTNNQVVTSGTLEITYVGGNNITGDFLPESTAEAMVKTGYSFTVRNTGTLPASYKIKLYNNPAGNTTNYLAHNQLYISFDNGTPVLISSLPKENAAIVNENAVVYLLLSGGEVGVESANDSESHNIKVWLKESADEAVIGKKVNLILEVEAIVD